MRREFTATTYIVQENAVLLIWHKKYGKWMPPGGHLLPHEAPHEAAIRETLEETGVEIELVSQDNIHLNTKEAKTIPRPYLCLLEEIPPYNGQPAHEHIDMIFLGKPLSQVIENEELQWFMREEIEELPSEYLFDDARQLILTLLQKR